MDLNDVESWPTGRLLVFTGRMVQDAFQEFLDAHGLTFAGMHVLRVLRDGPLAQVDVAARCGVQTQTAGRTIERLVRNGLVTRERDPADRRRRLVRLTDEGRGILEFIGQRERPADPGAGLFGVVEDRERFRAELIRIMRRLLARRAAGRAAQWSALAERWAGPDTSPGGPPDPPMPSRPPLPSAEPSLPDAARPLPDDPQPQVPQPHLAQQQLPQRQTACRLAEEIVAARSDADPRPHASGGRPRSQEHARDDC